ncbi:YugN-like family protein [Peribacillus sp. SCS-155]|uniref:YugN-like family protein n=1 Tax=Peribacillus sedimenti TaxID=3115297 RepID=UPI00390654B9
MIEIPSKLEGTIFSMRDAESRLKTKGFVVGGNWEYTHGYFDYKIDDQQGYQFVRIPFAAKKGELDSGDVDIQFGTPFLLSHEYKIGLDEHAKAGNMSAPFNQFQEPDHPDADFPEQYVSLGIALVHEAEKVLLD